MNYIQQLERSKANSLFLNSLATRRMIRIKATNVLGFDVVVPRYGFNKAEFLQNCGSFLSCL